MKPIKQPRDHSKLYGYDLETDPPRLGNDAAVTVIDMGNELDDKHHRGQRLAVAIGFAVNPVTVVVAFLGSITLVAGGAIYRALIALTSGET